MDGLGRGIQRPRTLPLLLYTGPGAIWPCTRIPVFLASTYALLIYALWRLGLSPNLGSGASSLSAILAMVTGLMVSYRSSSSNDRWHEGRRVWASLTSSTRTLHRMLAYSLPPRHDRVDAIDRAIDECMALVVAFAYALKHHLRDETDIDHPDLKDLLPLHFAHRMNRTAQAPVVCSSKPDRSPSHEPSDAHAGRAPLKRRSTPEADRAYRNANTDSPRTLAERALPGSDPRGTPLNLPLAILKQLHAYLNAFRTEPYPSSGSPQGNTPALDTPTWANCLGVLKDMTEQLTTAERIRDTPIPLALGVHLQQMLTLYIAAIPPQLVDRLGFWCVPVTAVAAFFFFGIDGIAAELSDPFGVEPNDLKTDAFCSDIRREWLELGRRSDGDEDPAFEWQPDLKA